MPGFQAFRGVVMSVPPTNGDELGSGLIRFDDANQFDPAAAGRVAGDDPFWAVVNVHALGPYRSRLVDDRLYIRPEQAPLPHPLLEVKREGVSVLRDTPTDPGQRSASFARHPGEYT
jgi:hypothetical protein